MNSIHFSLEEVVDIVNGKLLCGDPTILIQAMGTDTRRLVGGGLFIALRGDNFDGHDFVQQAAVGGARAAVVEKPTRIPVGMAVIRVANTLEAYGALASAHRRRHNIPLIGVTGSYGKTTTRALTAMALSSKFNTLSSEANFNNEVGVPQTLLQLDSSREAAVLEMGMRGLGQIDYLARIALPTVGVITNVGPQHIEKLGSLDKIAEAKAELIKSLPENGLAILPADDVYFDFLKRCARCRIASFGVESGDYRASDIVSTESTVSFNLMDTRAGNKVPITVPLLGKHNALNAAAAITAAVELGVELGHAASSLSNTRILNQRLQVTKNSNRDITVIDDCYNAGPYSMRAAVETLRDYPGNGRKVAILGEMTELGEWSESEHRKIGKVATACTGMVVGIGHQTRWLLEELGGNVLQHRFTDTGVFIPHLWSIVKKGDVVLVKGSRAMGLDRITEALLK